MTQEIVQGSLNHSASNILLYFVNDNSPLYHPPLEPYCYIAYLIQLNLLSKLVAHPCYMTNSCSQTRNIKQRQRKGESLEGTLLIN